MEPDFPATPFTEALLKENEELRTENALLRERCSELEERVNKNSQNSSKPPSSDGYQKPSKKGSDKGDTSSKEAPCSSQETPNPKSLRPSSGNKPGGQKGHQDSCLRRVALPDYVRHLKVEKCCCCQSSLIDIKPTKYIERQVFDPGRPGEFEVTAYWADVKVCPCGKRNTAEFPQGVKAAAQYGEVTQAMAVHLNHYHFIPYHRVSEYFNTIYCMSVSAGSVANFVAYTHENLASTEQSIRDALQESPVAGADETGMRVDGSLWWLHIMRDDQWTLYYLSERRGCEAMDAMGILLTFAARSLEVLLCLCGSACAL